MSRTCLSIACVAFAVACSPASESQSTPDAEVAPAFELRGAGQNVDSIAFWEAPDASATLLFVTAKDNSLVEVWRYPFAGHEQPALQHSSFGSSNVNGVFVDQETDLLYVTIGASASTTSVFALPSLAYQMSFNKSRVHLGGEPNCAMLKRDDGQKLFYVSADDVVYTHDATTGEYLAEFEPRRGLETIVADDFAQVLYIPDENDKTGVYAYDWQGRPHERSGASVFGAGAFQADAEGIILYICPSHGGVDSGCGMIVVADQRQSASDFEIFDRKTWEHLATFGIRGVSNTDGIASTQRALPDYPLGVFAAIHDDATTVGVGWDTILNALELGCPDSKAAQD